MEAAQQAKLMGKNAVSAYLKTAAWVAAGLGNTAEARALLLEAMEAANLEEPDGDVWYGFGRIYEQYGVNDAAVTAYQRVLAMKQPAEDPLGSVQLAKRRLAALR